MAKNTTTPLLIAAGVGAAIFFLRRKASASSGGGGAVIIEDPVEPPKVPPPPQPGKPYSPIPSTVIGGDPGYDWQPKSEWKTYGEIIGGFAALGYSVTNDYGQRATDPMIMLENKEAIKAFQRDYKYAAKFLKAWPQDDPKNFGKKLPPGPLTSLSADGWIGPNTWTAFKWAYRNATKFGSGPKAFDAWDEWVTAGEQL